MKADDDTFVMVDNLRRFLSNYDPNVPHFFGAYTCICLTLRECLLLWLSVCICYRERMSNRADTCVSLLPVTGLTRALIAHTPNTGRRFLLHRGEGPERELSYYSGGAGYVLSRAALKKLVRHLRACVHA